LSTERDHRLRRAETAVRQGRIDVAIGEYHSLLQEQPGDLAVANALGDLYTRAGQPGDAVACYLRVADAHLKEGFFAKAAGFYKKILRLTPEDEVPALRLADALAQQGLLVEAKAQLLAIEHARRVRGDGAGADEILLTLADLDPRDLSARLDAARLLILAGDPRGPDRLQAIVEALNAGGRAAEALDLMRELVQASPRDVGRRLSLVDALLARGDAASALQVLREHPQESDPWVTRRALELTLVHAPEPEAREAVTRWLTAHAGVPGHLDEFWRGLAAAAPTRRRLVVDACMDAALAAGDARDAERLVRALLSEEPRDVPALLRLVEICVDGGLHGVLAAAQVQLADAYVAAGRLREARVVLEDLLLRSPDDRGCRDRLVPVLAGLGVGDPDGAIDELLALDDEDEEVAAAASGAGETIDAPGTAGHVGASRGAAAPADAATVHVLLGPEEVDLTPALNALAAGEISLGPGEPTSVGAGAWPDPRVSSLEAVFERMRADASPPRGTDGRVQLALGRTYFAAGMLDEALATFQRAAQDAEARAAASVAIGETHEEQDNLPAAIEWFERGADASESPEADRIDAMRHLGEALEAASEPVRALAVWMELLTLRPSDRQASRHVARLSGGDGR
jgi:tetratricopeptide (TPR) repeat protein